MFLGLHEKSVMIPYDTLLLNTTISGKSTTSDVEMLIQKMIPLKFLLVNAVCY